MSELPAGWATTSLDDVADIASGITIGRKVNGQPVRSVPYLAVVNVQDRALNLNKVKTVDATEDEIARYSIKKDDLLLTEGGDPDKLGRGTLWHQELQDCIHQNHILRVRLKSNELSPKFLSLLISSPYGKSYFLKSAKQTTGIASINLGQLKRFPVLVPPLTEQKRIADKLDDLLARVDACRDRLDRVPAILKRFRQTVLAAATSGELTRDWREENGVQFPWPTRRLEEIGDLGRGKSKHRPRNDERLFGGTYPFIQTGDVAQSGGLIDRHEKTYSEFGLAQSKLWPARTVCITIAANIADTAILSYPACFPDSVVGFVADPRRAVPEFVKWCIDVIRDDLESFAPATAQKNINLAVLNNILFPCPSFNEQQEIVRRAQALLEVLVAVETKYRAGVERVEKLPASILSKAFQGELVPQDPNEEPASVLLDRIRGEADTDGQMKSKRGRKPREMAETAV